MAGRYKVVVSDQVFPSVETERAILAEIGADLEVADGTADDVARLAGDADAILNTYLPMTAELIGRLPQCRIIARYGIGVDNIDIDAASKAGIAVTNVPDYSVQEVAAHAVAMMLSLIRRLPKAEDLLRDGSWGIADLRPIRRISGLTFGLVGLGRIARQVATSLEPFGGRLQASDPFVQPTPGLPTLVSIEELIETSDVISVHAPLTPETRGLFNRAVFERMRPGAILVNTSRGPLIVLDDLLDALRFGHLGGAGLDVFEQEPLDPGRIADVPNLLATPHMAYYSEEALHESQVKAATQVVKVLTGVPPDYPVAH